MALNCSYILVRPWIIIEIFDDIPNLPCYNIIFRHLLKEAEVICIDPLIKTLPRTLS